MYYSIKHETHFRYSQPINESVMELYMQPRTEGNQRCLRFKLQTSPRARLFEQYDYLGNIVHFFDIPAQHDQLIVVADSVVELVAPPLLPERLGDDAWGAVDQAAHEGDFWDMLAPSPRTMPTPLLEQFALELDVRRRVDPLQLLYEITDQVFKAFDYSPDSTDVDSPMDVVLETRRGVCQDYAHVMAALVRRVGIPCRYVSGYLYYHKEFRSTPDATHAWVEAYLPPIGWVGFDPTNDILAGERHIRAAVGRDYDDVPPTRGIFKGKAETELDVIVEVSATEMPFAVESLVPLSGWLPETSDLQPQQQQQQQQ